MSLKFVFLGAIASITCVGAFAPRAHAQVVISNPPPPAVVAVPQPAVVAPPPPATVVYVAPTGVMPGPGYVWRYNAGYGWGWWHPRWGYWQRSWIPGHYDAYGYWHPGHWVG
jgi:hypothetical protein